MNDLTFAEDVQERKRRMLPMTFGALSSPASTLTNTVQPGQALPNSIAAMRKRLGTVQQELDDIDSKDVNMSGLQEFARQQGQAGEMASLNALAAQFAGEGFRPLQAQFLKRAAAAAEPVKVGGGMLTPQGQFIKDPVAARDTRRAALERQALGLEKQIGEGERAEQARLDRLAQQERDFDLRAQGVQTQRMLADFRINQPKPEDSKAFTRATNLRNELTKRSDKIQEGTRHAETVLTLLTDPTIAKDPTKQVSLVFAFGKMLDPESVVRESEYALIAQARGMFESLLQKPDQIMTGARLAPNQLASMRQIAQQLFAGSTQRRNDLMDYYRGIAQRNNIPVEDVLPMGASAAPGGGGPAVDDPLGMRRKPK